MPSKQELQKNITTKLSFFFSFLKSRNTLELFSVEDSKQDLFCMLFSILFDSQVVKHPHEAPQSPVLYLVSHSKHTAFLVTFDDAETTLQHSIDVLLSRAADLQYTRLIVLIPGTTDPASLSGLNFKRPFYFSAKRDIWNTPRLTAKLSSLAAQQQTVLSDYLTDTMLNTVSAGKSLCLPPHSTLPSKNFIGRKREIKSLRTLIQQGHKPIVISGSNGMGKTELAVQFARDYCEGTVFFVQFDRTFSQTISRPMFNGIVSFCENSSEICSETERYHTVLSVLAQCSSEDIIIIDNVDSTDHTLDYLMTEPAFQTLLELNPRLILITRSDTSHTSLTIDSMSERDLLKLMRVYYNNACPDKQLLPLIREVNHHTMMTELLARTLASSQDAWTPDTILLALQEDHLEQLDLPAITTNYDHCREYKTMYGHLQALFSTSAMTQETQTLLQCIELMPKDGFSDASLYDFLPEELHNSLRYLINTHWLKQHDGKLSAPFVERHFVWNNPACSEKQICFFLDNLWNTLDIGPENTCYIKQMEASFSAAAEKLPDTRGEYALRAGLLADILGHTQRAIHYYQRAAIILEGTNPPDYLGLAAVYIDASNLYGQIGDAPNFLEFRLRALDAMEHELPPDHLDLARAYYIVGQCYYDADQFQQSLQYFSKAIDAFKNVVSADDSDMSDCCRMAINTYCTVARSCKDAGEHTKALDHYLHALRIQEEYPQTICADTAELYNHIAALYHHFGDRERTIEYQLKALDIQKQHLPPNSIEMMQAYCDVGNRYIRYHNDSAALPFFLSAIDIGQCILPPDSSRLSKLYQQVRSIYGKLGDSQSARKYRRKGK